MPQKYAKLKKEWILRGWSDAPYVLINWTKSVQLELTKKAFYVIDSCDGNTDFNSMAFLPDHHIILDELISEGIVEHCEEGDSIDSIQKYRKSENPRLRGLQWSVTGLCNLNCRHCYVQAPSGRYGELSFNEMLRIIEQFEQANVNEISLTGGEPFLRKDLLDIITVLVEKRIRINEIYSNGVLITDEILEGIKRLRISPIFQISFDGYGSHENMRGKIGIEKNVIASIRKLRAAGFQVVIATSIDTKNIDRMKDTYDLLRGLDIQEWRISSPSEIGNWRGTTTQLSFDEEIQVYITLLKKWIADGEPFAIQLGGYFRDYGKDTLDFKDTAQDRFIPEDYDCSACHEKPFLLPNGVLLPCPGYTDTILESRMPNILLVGLSTAWKESALRLIANLKKKDLLDKNPECSRCTLFEECGMGCRATALEKTGSYMKKDPITCEMLMKGHIDQFRKLATNLRNQTEWKNCAFKS